MLTRRSVVAGACSLALLPKRAFAQRSDFNDLLDRLITKRPALLTSGARERESAYVNLLLSGGRGPRPNYPPPNRSISGDAERLIVACEVGNQNRYQRLYQHPTWPKGRSGVTIGIGYDVGYVDREALHADWGAFLSDQVIGALARGCGITGRAARRIAGSLRNEVKVPWNAADQQFHRSTLPLYVSQTLDRNFLPGVERLRSDDCLGALVSLVFNRGPSFKLDGERYREMRAIRLHIVRGDFQRVPGELRSMRRLWANDPDAQGLVERRELEARLFERGLANT